ncbi:protein GLUTAMINE DUMPER 4-like [Panicum virgatum]|uniref:Uncharacterized protein n=1 Tax=Panicum virgatum TaxID=38727 RepID=A0A8T0TWC6_PANVG|nr:protein GLUTAMINE DUMPER 4-like [Panicum virgatum]KAG2612994.1 hypothetical protein PVAP13_4KG329600 [Panicum virgatum]
MRPERGAGGVAAELTAGGGGRPSLWRTPTPYLFLGFVLMMGLIVAALLVLVCARRNAARRGAGGGEGKAASVRGVLVPLDREAPGVVVIMAGDALPSFLASAKPLASLAAPRAGGADAV